MAIQLTTPLTHDPGHGQPAEVYPLVQLVDFRIRALQSLASFEFQYGSVNAETGEWIGGKLPNRRVLIRDTPAVMGVGVNPATGQMEQVEQVPAVTDFTDMAAALLTKGSTGIPYLTELGGEFYAWFITQGYYDGTAV